MRFSRYRFVFALKRGDDNMRRLTSQVGCIAVVLALSGAIGCGKPEPLTAAKAGQILNARRFSSEPVYAEVPQKVWWNERFPKDEYDERALRTFDNLAKAGYVTVTNMSTPAGGTYVAKVTAKGFPILGTAPSARGPVFRAMICSKMYDGLRNFQRHPTEPTTGHGELVWHYANPTPMYPLFETKQNKPLNKPFVSLVAFYYKDHEYRFDVTVRKTEAE
jgi:hypothetical protein